MTWLTDAGSLIRPCGFHLFAVDLVSECARRCDIWSDSTAWALSDVVVVTDTDILAYTTLASSLCLVTALIGVIGTMLNSKPILTVYNVLMWPTFVCVLIIGSSAYRRHNLQLDRKLNEAWSQDYSDRSRLRIQNNVRARLRPTRLISQLNCCGYYNTLRALERHRARRLM